MTSLEMIRENYASMPDEKLAALALQDPGDFTSEALVMLKEEMAGRGLIYPVFNKTALPGNDGEEEYRNDERESMPVSGTPWFSTSYDEIMYPDKEVALPPGEQNIRELQAGIKHYHGLVARNGLICLAGILITSISYAAANNGGGTYVVTLGAILYGAIGFFKALSKKEQLINSLQKVQGEQSLNEEPKQPDNLQE